MADNHTMRVRQGDTYELSILYQDVDPDTDVATPIDLTGYTYEWHVAVGTSTHTYTTGPQIVVSAPATGVITLLLSNLETAAFDTAVGRHWFRITSSGGSFVATLLEGNVEVEVNA